MFGKIAYFLIKPTPEELEGIADQLTETLVRNAERAGITLDLGTREVTYQAPGTQGIYGAVTVRIEEIP